VGRETWDMLGLPSYGTVYRDSVPEAGGDWELPIVVWDNSSYRGV
jgi:hypothetical protein